MQRETFRPAVLAAVLAFAAQRRLLPGVLRAAGQDLGDRAMKWLDARRDRLDGGP